MLFCYFHCWDPFCPWKGLHRKRNQRSRLWVPSRCKDMGKMVCYFRCSRGPWKQCWKNDMIYISICQLCQLLEIFWCLCIESAYNAIQSMIETTTWYWLVLEMLRSPGWFTLWVVLQYISLRSFANTLRCYNDSSIVMRQCERFFWVQHFHFQRI